MPSKPKLHQPSPDEVAALIEGARLPEKVVPLCMRGDLQGDLEAAEEQLAAAETANFGSRMGDAPDVVEAKARVEALKVEVLGAVIPFRIRALADNERAILHAEHPPRDGNAEDAEAKYNVDAVERAMVRKGCVWPELTDAQWAVLEGTAEVPGKLTTWQKQSLVAAAYALAHRELAIPFLPAAS